MSEKLTVADELEGQLDGDCGVLYLPPGEARTLIAGIREMQEEIKRLRDSSTCCDCGRTMICSCPWCDAELERCRAQG